MRRPVRAFSGFSALALLTSAFAACDAPIEDAPPGTGASRVPTSPTVDGGAQASAATGAPGATSPDGASEPRRDPIPPDAIASDAVDAVTVIRTNQDRRAVSPLIYGMNTAPPGAIPDDVLAGITFLRRGGDRSNAYNWETNASNGAAKQGWANDMYLSRFLSRPNAAGELDRDLITRNLAAGRGTMIPFVLNDYVAGAVASNIPFTTPGWNIDAYFRRVELVKPAPFTPVPDTSDGVVYTDEHIDFLRRQFPGDILAPGPTQVMVGSDNEPDLYVSNFPMLQRGSGDPTFVNGVQVGNRLTGAEFTEKFIRFAARVKQMAPQAAVVGPDHFHFDGYTNFHTPSASAYSDEGRWFMDDFLARVRAASEATGIRLLDTWDFHWYPQPVFGGVFTWKLDEAVRPMNAAEIEAVVQGPRSYWDPDYFERSWITDDHLRGPAYILTRLLTRVEQGYPGTQVGVTEYFPGGCAHVSSAIGVADTLGIFGRMGVHLAAMWPHTCDLRFAFGGFRLFRNADGRGLRFDSTAVRVEHPEKTESSVYAASDRPSRVTAIVINKTASPRRMGLQLFHEAKLASVDVHRVDAAHTEPFLAEQATLDRLNVHVYVAPPMSASLLVFRAADP